MKVTWDDPAKRPYSQGVSQGVLYPGNDSGVAWNGLVSVTEGGETDQDASYFDGIRYHNRGVSLPFSGTISAFTYPDEFEPCIGIEGVLRGQDRQIFGLSYRTNNEIHLVYGALAAPAKSDYTTISDKPGPLTFDWNFTTLPVKIPGGKPSSHLVVMVDQSQPSAISDLEDLIYGTDTDDPVLPDPADIIAIFETYATVIVTDNGDDSFTVTGPDADVSVSGDQFTINWPSVLYIPEEDVFGEEFTFEDGVIGWSFYGAGTASGTIAQDSTWAHNGSYSALVTITVQGTGANEALKDVPAEPGDVLTVIFTVHAPAALTNLGFNVDWKNSSFGYISTATGVSGLSLAAGQDRTFIYRTTPAPDNTAYATLTFGFPNASPAGTAMALDDVAYSIQKPSDTYQVSSL